MRSAPNRGSFRRTDVARTRRPDAQPNEPYAEGCDLIYRLADRVFETELWRNFFYPDYASGLTSAMQPQKKLSRKYIDLRTERLR